LSLLETNLYTIESLILYYEIFVFVVICLVKHFDNIIQFLLKISLI